MDDQPTPREIEEAYIRMVQVMGRMAENAAHIANARRALFLAYVDEGFTEEQALELCKRMTFD